MRSLKLAVGLLFVLFCATVSTGAQTQNYAAPKASLPGQDYKKESPAINEMFQNVYVETRYLQTQVAAAVTSTGSASVLLSSTNTWTATQKFVGIVQLPQVSSFTYIAPGTTYSLDPVNNNNWWSCVATNTFTADGASTYTVVSEAWYGGAVSINITCGYLLDGALPPNGRQGTNTGLCAVNPSASPAVFCGFTDEIAPAAGSHSVCYRCQESSHGDTLTFGGTATQRAGGKFGVKWP